MTDRTLKVYEVDDGSGNWTHEWADGEAWEKGECIKQAHSMALLNGITIEIDFPIDVKQKAQELGVNLNAKPDKSTLAKLAQERRQYYGRADPFGQW